MSLYCGMDYSQSSGDIDWLGKIMMKMIVMSSTEILSHYSCVACKGFVDRAPRISWGER